MINVNIYLAIICTILGLSASRCKYGVYDNKVSQLDRMVILNKHNECRLLIANGKVPGQPRGVNLKRLHWDGKLAKAAQNIANTCVFEHVRVNDGRWFAVGQNLYISYSTASTPNANWTSAIQGWFDEHALYNFPHPSRGTGHYTQLVWADTKSVGCGYTFYKADGLFKYHKLYVCNYGPAGNIIGQAPYKVGGRGCESLC